MCRAGIVLAAAALIGTAALARAEQAYGPGPTLPAPAGAKAADTPMPAMPGLVGDHIAPIPAGDGGCGCGCGCGVPRPGLLRQLVGFFTYVRSRSDCCPCCKKSGCHVPPLYTYFLCPGCTLWDHVSPPCGYNDEGPPFKCIQGPGCGCGCGCGH